MKKNIGKALLWLMLIAVPAYAINNDLPLGAKIGLNSSGTVTSLVASLSNKLSDFASTTSAQLQSVISDGSGTGALLFGTGPTISNPTITGTATGNISGNAGTATALSTAGTTSTVLHGNASGAPTYGAVVLGDMAAGTASSLLGYNVSGAAQDIIIGSGLSFNTGTNTLSTAGGGGTVTTASVVSANGFGGTVANATTTPAITLTTSVSGIMKGNGTGAVAATAGTDYAPATSGSSVLKGNGSGGTATATAGTDYSAGTSGLSTGIVKSTTSTGALTIAVPGDFPTFNQNTTGSAASMAISGQTGLLSFAGITSTNRTKTVRDAADTLLELGGSYTPTGTWNWQSASVTWPTFNQNTTGSAGSVAAANITGATLASSVTASSIPCAGLSNGATGCSTATGTSGATIPLNNGNNTLSGTNSVTGVMTFTNSDWRMLGSSTGYTALTSDNAGASNFTMHLPAANDTLADLAGTQTFTGKTYDTAGSGNVFKINGTGITAISGNTATVATTTGTLTSTHCVNIDASGNLKDSGSTCGGGASGLTVGTTTITSGTTAYIEYNNGGTLGEYAISGSGTVAMTASPTFTGTLAAAAITGTTFNGVTIPSTTDTTALLGTAEAFTKSQWVTPVTDSISTATFTPDLSASNNHNITLVHASCPCTIANPSNITAGKGGVIPIKQSSSGSDLVTTWGSDYIFVNGVPPTLSTAANATDLLSYYVQDSTHIIASLLPSTMTTGNGSGFQNKFRNGSFQVSQRMANNTSLSLGTGSDAYWLDGWEYHITGAAVTGYWQNVAFTTSFGTYLPGYAQIDGAASNTAISMYQKIPAADSTTLAGQVVTAQFQFYNNSGASITPTVNTCYASAQDNFTTCTADLSAANMQACANGSTCLESYNFTPNASATNGYEVEFNFGAMTSGSDIIEMSGFDIRSNPGAVNAATNANPPSIEVPNTQAELARCQRYFYSTYGNGVAAATSTTTGATMGSMISATTIEYSSGTASFPVVMASTPTILYWDTSGNASKFSKVADSSGAFTANVGALAFAQASPNGLRYSASIGADAVAAAFQYTASAEQ